MSDATTYPALPTGQGEIGGLSSTVDAERFRIRRLDRYQWTIERWVPPGRKRGGKVSAGKWVTAGYYPTLDQAARRLIDKALLSGPELRSVEELIRAVEHAREYVAQVVREVE